VAKHTPATTRALNKIEKLDLTEIVARTAKEYRWTAYQADEAEDWYKNFLKLCYLNRRSPVAALGQDADILWHQHILDTVRYQKDCKALFGHYLNHDPVDGPPSAADRRAFARSKKLYLKEYGALPTVMVRVCLHIPIPPHPGPGPGPRPRRRRKA
jgi:hypothetical protein